MIRLIGKKRVERANYVKQRQMCRRYIDLCHLHQHYITRRKMQLPTPVASQDLVTAGILLSKYEDEQSAQLLDSIEQILRPNNSN